ncbi:MAG: beta-galactosidase [Candidatus Omnitrophica bacterium]|nr:beta-galactosidase [Candidatus Omnitrophota bacterium]
MKSFYKAASIFVICATVLFNFFQSPSFSNDKAAPRIKEDTFGAYLGGGLGIHAPIELWQREIDCLKKAKIGIARFNSDCWDAIEPQRGVYKWEAMDKIINLLNKNGIKILFTVPISSSWNTSAAGSKNSKIAATHFPAKDLRDIENLCFNLAHRYKDQITHWEAWNKPDLPDFWKGRISAPEYLETLKAMRKGLKRGNPDCKVVIGGLLNPWSGTYLKSLLKHGAGDYFDIMNIHIYTPEASMARLAVMNIRQTLNDYGINKPLWVTEISTTPDYYKTSNYDKEELFKAQYLVKSCVVLLSEGVEKIFWHSLRKCGRDVGLKKDFDFGLLNSDFGELPAYLACEKLLFTLAGSSFAKKTPFCEGVCFYTFRTEDSTIYIVWSENGKNLLKLPIILKGMLFRDIFDKEIGGNKKGCFEYWLDESPIYIEEKINKKRFLSKTTNNK